MTTTRCDRSRIAQRCACHECACETWFLDYSLLDDLAMRFIAECGARHMPARADACRARTIERAERAHSVSIHIKERVGQECVVCLTHSAEGNTQIHASGRQSRSRGNFGLYFYAAALIGAAANVMPSASLTTSSTCSQNTNFRSSRTLCGTSSRSLRFLAGSSTRRMPAR